MKFGVPGRIGFHFHDLFIETFVELGVVGVTLIAYVMLFTCWKSLRLIIRHGMSVEYVYALSVSFLFFIIGPVLFFSVIPRLAAVQEEMRERHAQASKA